jgi:hypothetical protein
MARKPYALMTEQQRADHQAANALSRAKRQQRAEGTEYPPHDAVTEHTGEQIISILDGARPSVIARPKRGFVDWTPQPGRAELAANIEAVIAEYQDYLPITNRQIYYRLVGTGVDDKSDDFSEKIGIVCGHMRRAGRIEMDAIRDDGGAREEPLSWVDENEWIENSRLSAKQARLDRQEGQQQKLIIWCEAAGMVPQVARVANEYGVPVISSGGTDSITEKHALGIEARYFDRKKNPFGVHVLHIGDLDPHGIHIFIALAEDASAFCREAENDFVSLDFTRIAVTPAQIIDLGLVKNKLKPFKGMPAFPYDFTCQVEAIPPDELADIIRSAITDQRENLTGWKFNEAAYARVLKAEKRLQKSLLKRLKDERAAS